ncbi:hypothetical protein BD414DRAFT_298250 [Trametes punicea]|nr:hypothetical protein BD414DRAFT_298250 [Trametes punicea]
MLFCSVAMVLIPWTRSLLVLLCRADSESLLLVSAVLATSKSLEVALAQHSAMPLELGDGRMRRQLSRPLSRSWSRCRERNPQRLIFAPFPTKARETPSTRFAFRSAHLELMCTVFSTRHISIFAQGMLPSSVQVWHG